MVTGLSATKVRDESRRWNGAEKVVKQEEEENAVGKGRPDGMIEEGWNSKINCGERR